MSSGDKCCWPHCRNERDCLYLDKPLCDKHCDMVQSEDEKAANRARKKIGLPPFSSTPQPRKDAPVPTPPPLPPVSETTEVDLSGIEERLVAGYFDLDEQEGDDQ